MIAVGVDQHAAGGVRGGDLAEAGGYAGVEIGTEAIVAVCGAAAGGRAGPRPFLGDRHNQRQLGGGGGLNPATQTRGPAARVMRGQSRPTGLMYGPGVNGFTEASDVRYPYDPEASKKLLAEAGYPNGFGVTLDCPNDRYVNDEAICQAVTVMLARAGIKVTLAAQTRLKYFAEISNPDYHTSFYMLGWTPNTYDALNALYNLAGTRSGTRGIFNDGGYSSKEFDALLAKMAVETDPAKRQQDILDASKIAKDEVATIPLHQQTVVWAAKTNIELQQLADDTFPLRYVRVK